MVLIIVHINIIYLVFYIASLIDARNRMLLVLITAISIIVVLIPDTFLISIVIAPRLHMLRAVNVI